MPSAIRSEVMRGLLEISENFSGLTPEHGRPVSTNNNWKMKTQNFATKVSTWIPARPVFFLIRGIPVKESP